jgi:1,5-anhydro-D-fructose reductase (1,5-anhydro-D-mannitol-forming)
MIRFGIVGYGKMGQLRAQTFAAAGGQIAMIYDNEAIIAPQYPVASHYSDIINSPDVDAVVLCLPTAFNQSLTLEALKAGKHVFCEKPPAFTAAEVQEVMEVEKAAGKKLMYGFNHRHHDAVLKIKELVDSGRYGKVLWMRGRYGKSVDSSYLDTWRAKKELAGGGILLDQGIHMLDLFLHLGGSFDEVNAFVSSLYWELDGIEDNVFAIMKNSQTGIVASLHSTMTQWRHLFSLEVFLEAGYMVLNGLKTGSGTYGDEILTVAKNRSQAPAATWDDEERFHFTVDMSWEREARNFYDVIEHDKPVVTGSSSDAYNVMNLIDLIYQNDRHEAENLNTALQTIKD